MHDIFAVIWVDFIPLSLPCDSAEEAVEKAQAMHAKAVANKIDLGHVRAVRLPAGSDKLIDLWRVGMGP